MKFYLVRHGDAVEKEVDPERPLSEEGRADVEKVAATVGPSIGEVDVIWHSTKVRARQTAEVFGSYVKSRKGVIEREGLDGDDKIGPVFDEMMTAEGDIMIVGHNPFLADLVALAVVDDDEAEVVDLAAGGIICLDQPDNDDTSLSISWMVVPQILG